VKKYRCIEECVPRQLAIELERKYMKYLSKKPKENEGYKLLESDDEEEEVTFVGKGEKGGNEKAQKTNEQNANDFLTRIDYDSDMEI
jgi:hypothetical protein